LPVESLQRRAIVCVVYRLTAFLDVPIVYLSSKLLADVHPSSSQLITSMKTTLLAWFVPIDDDRRGTGCDVFLTEPHPTPPRQGAPRKLIARHPHRSARRVSGGLA
jgi:hypothetical protein